MQKYHSMKRVYIITQEMLKSSSKYERLINTAANYIHIVDVSLTLKWAL